MKFRNQYLRRTSNLTSKLTISRRFIVGLLNPYSLARRHFFPYCSALMFFKLVDGIEKKNRIKIGATYIKENEPLAFKNQITTINVEVHWTPEVMHFIYYRNQFRSLNIC